jgi:hypothetical protein
MYFESCVHVNIDIFTDATKEQIRELMRFGGSVDDVMGCKYNDLQKYQ